MLYSLALGNSSVKTAGKLEIAGSRSRSKESRWLEVKAEHRCYTEI